MLNLISNNCVEEIVLDDGGGLNEGEIYYVGGEYYQGEIKDDLPIG